MSGYDNEKQVSGVRFRVSGGKVITTMNYMDVDGEWKSAGGSFDMCQKRISEDLQPEH